MQSFIHLVQVISTLLLMHGTLMWVVKTYVPADKY